MSKEIEEFRNKKQKRLKGITEDTPLSIQQMAFCEAYMLTLSLSDAARAIGSTSKYPNQVGHLMMQRPNVKAHIAKLREERAKKAKVDAFYVLEGFKEIAQRCLQKEPVLEWNGVEWVPTGEWKFDAAGANKAYENIGKHIGFYDVDNNQKRALIQINIDQDDQGL